MSRELVCCIPRGASPEEIQQRAFDYAKRELRCRTVLAGARENVREALKFTKRAADELGAAFEALGGAVVDETEIVVAGKPTKRRRPVYNSLEAASVGTAQRETEAQLQRLTELAFRLGSEDNNNPDGGRGRSSETIASLVWFLVQSDLDAVRAGVAPRLEHRDGKKQLVMSIVKEVWPEPEFTEGAALNAKVYLVERVLKQKPI